MVKNVSPGIMHPVSNPLTYKGVYSSLQNAVEKLRPSKPLYVLYPEVIAGNAARFAEAFPGESLYAVKTNPDEIVLDAVCSGGIQSFDVASIEEIARVRARHPAAEIYFMHPVKAPEDIRTAYFDYGVRNFVLDCKDELFKILRETDLAQDLNLFIRLALPKNNSAMIDFSSKFGAPRAEAVKLLRETRNVASTLSVSFHVGTQTTNAEKYASAVFYVADILREANVKIDAINVGGGFPVLYNKDEPVDSLEDCVAAIKNALKKCGLATIRLLAEPGRILVANGACLVTRVELRKDDTLYINDGIYGGLFDACDWLGLNYPVKAFTSDRAFDGEMKHYRMAGPTCDSLDMMQGPFSLPSDIGIGDWVVFLNTGAYSSVLRSNFNGFGHADVVCVSAE
ncbi:MAG: hypothetical protein CMH27_00565 [Micavibrio sp.]|nr:hypothetical protein [Micavibrio sp.]|tara:strand:- start:11333 stop:12523 length:1191 start_codon:yes stop_codon:yes gene_type:complete